MNRQELKYFDSWVEGVASGFMDKRIVFVKNDRGVMISKKEFFDIHVKSKPAFSTIGFGPEEKEKSGGYDMIVIIPQGGLSDQETNRLFEELSWQKDKPKFNRELSDEIIQMFAEDQEIRNKVMESMTPEGDIDPAIEQLGVEIDERNTKRMKEIVETYGWPGNSLLGKEAAASAIFLMIHADRDITFQNKCLSLMKIAAGRRDLDLATYAVFTDRVLINQKKKQIYGTQGTCSKKGWKADPLQDKKNIETLRKDVALQTFQAYQDLMDEQCRKWFK